MISDEEFALGVFLVLVASVHGCLSVCKHNKRFEVLSEFIQSRNCFLLFQARLRQLHGSCVSLNTVTRRLNAGRDRNKPSSLKH